MFIKLLYQYTKFFYQYSPYTKLFYQYANVFTIGTEQLNWNSPQIFHCHLASANHLRQVLGQVANIPVAHWPVNSNFAHVPSARGQRACAKVWGPTTYAAWPGGHDSDVGPEGLSYEFLS